MYLGVYSFFGIFSRAGYVILIHFYFIVAHLQGLECNAKHWPCLDGVITVLYVLNNYEGESERKTGEE